MEETGFAWFYLLFFIFPLVRILPRMIRKFRKEPNEKPYEFKSQTQETVQTQRPDIKEQTPEMQVLGEINRDAKDFNRIQKNLGIDNQELEKILNKLEEDGLMKVVKKGGLLGVKVELHPTDKGFKKYYS